MFQLFVQPEALLLVFTGTLLSFVIYAWRLFNIIPQTYKKHKLPPVAPYGFLDISEKLSGQELPFHLYDISRGTKSQIFRCHIPFLPGGYGITMVGQATAAQDILRDESTVKTAPMYQQFGNIGGATNIITSADHSDAWAARRKGVRPAFSAKQHVHRMNKICGDIANDFCENRLDMDKPQVFDPASEMMHLSISAICEAGFRYKITRDEAEYFAQELKHALIEFAAKRTNNPLRGLFTPFLKDAQRAVKATKNVQKFLLHILLEYRQSRALKNSGGDYDDDSTILGCIEKNPIYKNDQERIADMVMFLIAGHDTTAYTLAWILLELGKHAGVQTKLREELAKCPPSDPSKCLYLHHVIQEGMRLHPVVAGGAVRTTGRDFLVKTGGERNETVILPKGASCLISTYMIAHDPEVFPNPFEFNVSRWEKATPEMKYFPFMVGRRNCVGQQLAQVEIHTVLARLIREYHFDVVEEGTTAYFLSLKPAGAMMRATKIEGH